MNFKARTLKKYSFIFGYGRGAQVGKASFLKKTKHFLTMRSNIVRRLHSWQWSGVVSQQRLRLDVLTLIKRSPKLRSESVSFLFLVCFSNEKSQSMQSLNRDSTLAHKSDFSSRENLDTNSVGSSSEMRADLIIPPLLDPGSAATELQRWFNSKTKSTFTFAPASMAAVISPRFHQANTMPLLVSHIQQTQSNVPSSARTTPPQEVTCQTQSFLNFYIIVERGHIIHEQHTMTQPTLQGFIPAFDSTVYYLVTM
eukprot:UN04781